MNNDENGILPKHRRDFSIDLLKVIAIFGVVVLHSCSYSYDIASANWSASVFLGSLFRASVPIFFMCSGALLLAPKKNFTVKKFFTKNVLRIVVSMLVWAMAYKIFHLLVEHSCSIANIFQAIKEVLLFNQEFHLYFLQIILLVYLFLPITRIITQYATKKQLEYLMALWFVFGILFPTVVSYWPFTLLSDIQLQYKINMTYAAIGYGLFGYYLKQYLLRSRVWYIILFAAGFLLTFGGTHIASISKGIMDTQFFEGMSVGVCLMAAGIFGFCVSAAGPKNIGINRIIIYLSEASFCIYLSHVFFNYALISLGITAGILPTVLSTPLIAIIMFVCGLLTYYLLSKIPIAKKWII
jgi:surface polysaccharide O-acyltransferase-like enzyme